MRHHFFIFCMLFTVNENYIPYTPTPSQAEIPTSSASNASVAPQSVSVDTPASSNYASHGMESIALSSGGVTSGTTIAPALNVPPYSDCDSPIRNSLTPTPSALLTRASMSPTFNGSPASLSPASNVSSASTPHECLAQSQSHVDNGLEGSKEKCCCGKCNIESDGSAHKCSVTGKRAISFCLAAGGDQGFGSSFPCKTCVLKLCACSLGYKNCKMRDKDMTTSPYRCKSCFRFISPICEPELAFKKQLACRQDKLSLCTISHLVNIIIT